MCVQNHQDARGTYQQYKTILKCLTMLITHVQIHHEMAKL